MALLNEMMFAELERGKSLILACSALKQLYRDLLSSGPQNTIRFVFLKGDFALIFSRMQLRSDHFMRADMLDSQFADLEEPEDAVTVQIENDAENLIHMILQALQ